jgi:hypothetical protein
MSRALNDLSSHFRPLAVELLARLCEAGIPVMVIDTLRTPAEQADNIARVVSWTKNSKHLADIEGKSNAIDICPYAVYDIAGPDKLAWDSGHPVWNKIGAIGEALGLRWGGRWAQKDMGHFEYPTPPDKRA